jgi:hypothetical protein
MPARDVEQEREHRRAQLKREFSNYESSVTLIGSLEGWFDYRWGKRGRVKPGQLECFNRFPADPPLTPDFEVRFRTPYTIWGECKREINPQFVGDIEQVLDYAKRKAKESTNGYDVLVFVRSENDAAAAKAIDEARQALLERHRIEEESRQAKERMANEVADDGDAHQKAYLPSSIPELPLAPIIVLGYYRDRESINNEWYVVNWRRESNGRFSCPNVCADPSVDDLNKLFCAATHHPIPVDKLALERTGRNPFINDAPPPLYTALRLVVPALAQLLTTDEAEELQASGRVEKVVSRDDILSTQFCRAIQPQPGRIASWIDAAFNAMANEIGAAHAIANTTPPQYKILIDRVLIKADIKEIWSDRAALKAARAPGASGGKRTTKTRGDDSQPRLFE